MGFGELSPVTADTEELKTVIGDAAVNQALADGWKLYAVAGITASEEPQTAFVVFRRPEEKKTSAGF
jgi:hypothetical protein